MKLIKINLNPQISKTNIAKLVLKVGHKAHSIRWCQQNITTTCVCVLVYKLGWFVIYVHGGILGPSYD